MAEMQGLYFGMGIDTSQLHSDFIDAEKTINQNIAQINKEIRLVQIKGQVELEGLDESASMAEKLRVQEEALTEQIGLQQDKIILLGATYEHLRQTKGEYSEATQQVEYQLLREQLAAQRLQKQLADLSEQEKIAIGFNFEMLALIEPMWKGLEAAVAAGRTLPIPMLHAKAAAAGLVGLGAFVAGTMEETEELREKDPAKILDENFKQAAVSIDDSWQRISESTQRGTAEMQKHAEQVKSLEFKILPEINEVDFVRFVKVLENYRPSEAIVNTIELINQSDSVIGKLVSALIGLGYTITTIHKPIIEFARTSVDAFSELNKDAKELNLSLDKTSDLTTQIEFAGGDYDDVRDYVRGVQDAVIKGDSEDPEVLALEKYGVVIQDTNGKLLAFDETLERLYQGYLKAREAGEAEAYVMMTNGQSLHDVLPYFEGVAEAQENMAKIKWATLDYATLSEVSTQMKLVEAQTVELQKSLSSLAAPVADIFLKDTLDILRTLTELIEENREEIIYWSFVFAEAVKSFQNFEKELGGEAKDKVIEFGETLKSFFADEPVKDIAEEAKENLIPFYTELKKLEEEFGVISKVEKILPEGFEQEFNDAVDNYLVPFYEKLKAIKEELSLTNKVKNFLSDRLTGISGEDSIIGGWLARAQERLEEFKKANEEAHKEIEKTKNDLAGLSYSLNRIAKYKSELENLKFDMQYGKDFSYEKTAAQNKLWYETAMKDAKQYANEQAIIEELYAAKSEQIEQEKEQKLAEIRERITLGERTELEKRIADIEREKQTWIQAGMEKAEAEELAQKQLTDYIKSQEKELSETLQTLYNTELENRLAQIEKEKQAWIDKCGDEVKATELAEQQKADAQRAAAMSVLKQQAKEYKIYQRDGLEGLKDYKERQLIKSGVAPDYLNMTPQQLQQFQRANQIAEKSLLPNFMTDRDKEMYRREMLESPADYKKRAQKYDDENYVIYDGKKTPLSSVTGYDKGLERLQNIYNEALGIESDLPNVLSDVEKNFSEMSPVIQTTTESLSELPATIQEVKEQLSDIPEIEQAEMPEIDSNVISEVVQGFSELPEPIQAATESLNELPTAVQGVMEQISAIEPQQQENSLPSVLSELEQSFSQLPTVIQTASDSLNSLPITISGLKESLTGQVSQLFSPMTESLTSVTVKISDVSGRIENVSSVLNTFLSALNKKINQLNTTPNVTNNISIEEAHAWDYSHIQQLAEKVADIIEPTILRAVGGNSNSYG